MARKSGNKKGEIEVYKHDDTRKNAVPVGLASYDTSKLKPKKYEYDPHLDPQLVWAGKAEHTSFEVPTVSLHIHERIAPEAIIRSVKREDPQKKLFATPDLPLKKLVEFYQHEMDWTNRLILGDSLLIANSLLEREMMAGKVQCIFFDPPYGVKFSSNFQPSVKQRDVKDQDEYLVREPEQIRAYRDTWQLGIHSYLTYLRDRLLSCRDLLSDTGSIFVQISDENLHHVRELMDEVFGTNNFMSIIYFSKTTGQASSLLPTSGDYLLWYARNKEQVKYHQLFWEKKTIDLASYCYVESPDGKEYRRMTKEEMENNSLIPKGWKIFSAQNMRSQGYSSGSTCNFEFKGRSFYCGDNHHWKTTPEGLKRLVENNCLLALGNSLNYKRYVDDYPVYPITSQWDDTAIAGFSGEEKVYVVQTAIKVVQRCILMVTDPGDLVFDPTCGSGTTAYVAEQWGRRWITCDTSRVALTLARQRLMTAVFPYYKLADEKMGIKGGFIYEEVPHITLKSIAQNEPAQKEILFDKSEIDRGMVRVAGPLTVEGIPQHSSADFEGVNYESPVVIARSEATKQSQDEILRSAQNDKSIACRDILKTNAENHIHTLIELLRKDGVTFPENKRMKFENLIPVSGGFIHAEGEPVEKNGVKKVAVSFGPPHGPVTVRQVQDGIHDAYLSGYDAIIFCGFAFDAAAQDVKHPKIKVFYSHIRPDVLMGDLLKTTAASQLFTVFGEPDIEIKVVGAGRDLPKDKGKKEEIKYEIILKGVDIYDPLTGEIYSDNGDKIAAWFVDTDYDKRTFCVSQAFFPDSTAWDKLKRALKATIDEDKFELLTSTRSLPFKLGTEKRIAVKVIDHRGNEVMVVREIE